METRKLTHSQVKALRKTQHHSMAGEDLTKLAGTSKHSLLTAS